MSNRTKIDLTHFVWPCIATVVLSAFLPISSEWVEAGRSDTQMYLTQAQDSTSPALVEEVDRSARRGLAVGTAWLFSCVTVWGAYFFNLRNKELS